jgi:hypothetical protein
MFSLHSLMITPGESRICKPSKRLIVQSGNKENLSFPIIDLEFLTDIWLPVTV